ncbi:MAG: phage terminase large subunit [Hyphomicrobium sp.]|uniref:phage terminase large subunit n=1 Tax=Hyphomicrobium sp. TaxID=82 RepID=UPI0039E31236
MILKPNKAEIFNAMLRQDLAAFIGKTFSTVDAGQEFSPNWHIEVIADRLMRAYRREIKRLIIALPPRNLKSISASVAFPAWALGKNPCLRFICASYSQDLAGKLARDCRTVMSSPWYRRAFSYAALNPSKTAEGEFETTAGGYRLSTSVGGTLTGRGGNFIVIDDPIKPQEAQSEPRRQSVKQWYDSTLYSRLDNKKDDVIIVIMQRVHVDDLVAHIMEKEEWEYLKLPAIAEEDEAYELSNGRVVGRSAGEALHAEREPLKVLKRTRSSMSSFEFSAQYQQSPVPAEGNLLKWSWFRSYDNLPPRDHNVKIVQSWDLATTISGASDWSVCTTWLVHQKQYYLRDVLRERMQFPDLRRKILSHAQEFDAKVVLIEEAGIGLGMIQQLRSERNRIRTIGIRPEGSKVDRAAAQSAIIEAGAVLLPRRAPWLDTFHNEILVFPNGRNDDQVDSMSQMLNWSETRSKKRVGVLF